MTEAESRLRVSIDRARRDESGRPSREDRAWVVTLVSPWSLILDSHAAWSHARKGPDTPPSPPPPPASLDAGPGLVVLAVGGGAGGGGVKGGSRRLLRVREEEEVEASVTKMRGRPREQASLNAARAKGPDSSPFEDDDDARTATEAQILTR